jgi:hypothetical protein
MKRILSRPTAPASVLKVRRFLILDPGKKDPPFIQQAVDAAEGVGGTAGPPKCLLEKRKTKPAMLLVPCLQMDVAEAHGAVLASPYCEE